MSLEIFVIEVETEAEINKAQDQYCISTIYKIYKLWQEFCYEKTTIE